MLTLPIREIGSWPILFNSSDILLTNGMELKLKVSSDFLGMNIPKYLIHLIDHFQLNWFFSEVWSKLEIGITSVLSQLTLKPNNINDATMKT